MKQPQKKKQTDENWHLKPVSGDEFIALSFDPHFSLIARKSLFRSLEIKFGAKSHKRLQFQCRNVNVFLFDVSRFLSARGWVFASSPQIGQWITSTFRTVLFNEKILKTPTRKSTFSDNNNWIHVHVKNVFAVWIYESNEWNFLEKQNNKLMLVLHDIRNISSEPTRL